MPEFRFDPQSQEKRAKVPERDCLDPFFRVCGNSFPGNSRMLELLQFPKRTRHNFHRKKNPRARDRSNAKRLPAWGREPSGSELRKSSVHPIANRMEAPYEFPQPNRLLTIGLQHRRNRKFHFRPKFGNSVLSLVQIQANFVESLDRAESLPSCKIQLRVRTEMCPFV